MKDFFILKGERVELAGVPAEISILPLGHVRSSKGDFDVDEESFAAMQRQIVRRGVDLVVDYEHQTLKGVEAPAAGWVKALKLEDGQIKAEVEWTPRGEAYLKNREYRYLSPVILAKNGKAMGLHSLALTNTPAILGMTPIVNSDTFDEGGEEHMDLKELAEALGLGADATMEQILETAKALAAEAKSLKEKDAGADTVVANKAVCELLGLKAGAETAEVTAKIMELKGGIIDGVNVLAKLQELEKKDKAREAEGAVTLALKAGKITPAQKEWATQYAMDNPAGFQSFVEKAPQVVPMGELKLAADGGTPLKNDQLDESTLLVCRQLGLSPDEVKKYNQKEE